MDLGHGQGSFDWVVAEVASKAGFWPDVVSSDLHSGNVGGPARDLAHVMSKVRALGMPLKNVRTRYIVNISDLSLKRFSYVILCRSSTPLRMRPPRRSPATENLAGCQRDWTRI